MPAQPRTLSRVKSRMDARHLMRYLQSKAGSNPEDIAKSERVSVKTVRDSIREMERYESMNSEGQVTLAVRNLILSTMPKVAETIDGLLSATNTVERKNSRTGLMDYVGEPDKITRLEALKVFRGFVETTQPKVPQVVTNVNQTNQTAVLSSAETPEERMRRLRNKANEHNLLPPVVAGVPKFIDEGIVPDDYGADDEEGDDED
jgi:hypothetical protein